MAILCRRYNLLFIMTPRTACTAIGDLLCLEYGGEFCPSEDILDRNGRIAVQKKHSTLDQLVKHRVLQQQEIESFFKFASVRNPFDSLLSLYLKQRSKYQPLLEDPGSWVNRLPAYVKSMRYARRHSFDKWVLRKCAKQLTKGFFGRPRSMFQDYTHGMDAIMRYENIENDFRFVLARAGVEKNVTIPIVNRTVERSDRDYRSSYSRLATLAVTIAFAEDLRRYEYRF